MAGWNEKNSTVSKNPVRLLPLSFCLLSAVSLGSVAFAQGEAKSWNFSDPKAAPLATQYTAPGGVTSNVEIKVVNGALRLTNKSGGSFGVKIEATPFDAQQFPLVNFDYTRSNDAKINFFFKVNGAFYGVIFAGPSKVRPGSFLLGTIPGVGNKGKVVIPLRDWLRRFQPKADKLIVEEILVGNWDNDGYLLAGIGGNGPGANWTLQSFSLTGEPKADKGHFGKPTFIGNDIVWPLNGAPLDTRSAELTIDSQKFDFNSSFLRLETQVDAKNLISQKVIFDAAAAGMVVKDGQTLALGLGGETASLTFNVGSHISPAPLPRLNWQNASGEALIVPGSDFETDMGGWTGGNAVLQLDKDRPFEGAQSLQFYNRSTASTFDSSLSGAPFDAAQLPVITFAYRADDRLRIDFRLMWEGVPYYIRFFDRDGAQTKLGEIQGLVADDKWHRAQIPLLDMMKKARPTATNFKIDSFGLSDDAWMGNARALTFNIDNFRFAPKVTDAIRATATLADITGVTAVSWQLDQTPDTVPDRSPEGGPKLDIPLSGRAAGIWWLHVRAQSGSGGWSETSHFPISIG
ncbi:hypothetical protein EON80_15150 [bacterium]|nr:MAG: hypothetical protein EON80_15150 [bacterium]